jgi:hypothetical protein
MRRSSGAWRSVPSSQAVLLTGGHATSGRASVDGVDAGERRAGVGQASGPRAGWGGFMDILRRENTVIRGADARCVFCTRFEKTDGDE